MLNFSVGFYSHFLNIQLVTELKKKNTANNRKLKKTSSHSHASKIRTNKSRKNSYMSATSSDHHDMDVGSPNGSISRSKNPSPIPGHSYRYERYSVTFHCIFHQFENDFFSHQDTNSHFYPLFEQIPFGAT